MAIDDVERAAGIPYCDAALLPMMLEDMASRWLTSGRTSVSEWHQKISAAQQLRQGILGTKDAPNTSILGAHDPKSTTRALAITGAVCAENW